MTVKQTLCEAIASRHLVTLTRGNDPKGSQRTGAPHILFDSTTGQECVAFFQTEGYTSSGGLPQWRNVPLENIETVQVHDERQFVPELSFNRTHPQYAHIICG
jgi:hypothetical protein